MNNNDKIECPACNKQLHKTAIICPSCGAAIRKKGYKSKTVAAVLGILIGGFGIHRFYLGQWWGVFYLLLFWTFIPGIVSLIEGIVFLCRNDEKWDEKYNDGVPNVTGGSGAAAWLLVAVVGAFVLVAIIGILAAIALPAYADYTKRAKVAELLIASSPVKAQLADYRLKNNAWPAAGQFDLADWASVPFNGRFALGENGSIIITVPVDVTSTEQVSTVILQPSLEANEQVLWDCSAGTLEMRWRPASCRQ